MIEYERGGGGHSLPPSTTVTMVWLIYMKNMEKGGDTGQFGNVQESERYVIPVSGTKTYNTKL